MTTFGLMVILNGILCRHSFPLELRPGLHLDFNLVLPRRHFCGPNCRSRALISKTHPPASTSFVWLVSVFFLRKNCSWKGFCVFMEYLFVCQVSSGSACYRSQSLSARVAFDEALSICSVSSQDEPSPHNETIAAWSAA